jgi:feruloyl esterase
VFHPDGPIKQLYQYLIFYRDPGPGHSAREFDFDRDPPRLALMESLYSALNPDLRRFRARGGKLIIYQGWDDVEVTPINTIDYFETMEATMGGRDATRKFARLFMLPGVAHCRRGPGADTVDWLTALEAWVENGQAPDRVVAHHQVVEQGYLGLPRPRFPLEPAAVDWARPLFPYPAVARFSGKGDPDRPGNWVEHQPADLSSP